MHRQGRLGSHERVTVKRSEECMLLCTYVHEPVHGRKCLHVLACMLQRC